MLYLQAGIHLKEIKALVFTDHKFHRTRALVFHRFRQRNRLLAHGFARGFADKGTWRLFNHFLVTPLNRTLALVKVQDVTVRVSNQLNFNMARLFNKFLNEDTVIAKAVSGFIAATGKALQSFFIIESHAQAFATAARRSFDHDGITNTLGNLNCTFWRFNRIINARNTVHTGLARQLFRFNFVAHGGNRVMLGTDEGNALFFTALGKLSVLT